MLSYQPTPIGADERYTRSACIARCLRFTCHLIWYSYCFLYTKHAVYDCVQTLHLHTWQRIIFTRSWSEHMSAERTILFVGRSGKRNTAELHSPSKYNCVFFFHFFHWNFSNRAVRSKFTVKFTCYRCKKNDTIQFVYRIRLNGFYIWRKKNMPKIVSECEECVLKVARTGIKSIFHVKLKIMETWWTRDFIYQQSVNFPEKMQGDENVKRFLFVLFLILWAARAIITVTQ